MMASMRRVICEGKDGEKVMKKGSRYQRALSMKVRRKGGKRMWLDTEGITRRRRKGEEKAGMSNRG